LRVAEPVLLTGGAALLFDVPAGEFSCSVSDPRHWELISEALRRSDTSEGRRGTCSLTGRTATLVPDKFPEALLPIIGKTILFSRFDAIPANRRYGQFGARSFEVAQDTAERLAAALHALTRRDLDGITWRKLPSESKHDDVLLAFVDASLEAPVAGALATDEETIDFAEEALGDGSPTDSVAAFEKRTQRVIDAVRAKLGADFRTTPVRLAVFRRVDPANRKIAFATTRTVENLYAAALNWLAGERNIPPWLSLPLQTKRGTVQGKPPHVAPLGVTSFTKQLFLRGGLDRHKVSGLPAAEAIGLFFEGGDRRVARVLRMVLGRRTMLLLGAVHTMRRAGTRGGREGGAATKGYDHHEALRTVTLLGVLLHKLGRTEGYMSDVAFKLGQLLAAADVVHAGYCADVRGGDIPPSLLGNQVFSTAQTTPAKALAVLCRRWKPYDGWAKKAARDRERVAKLVNSGKKDDQRRGWDIRTALRHARAMRPLADGLRSSLTQQTAVDDSFRAELLLGYIAGLPPAPKDDDGDGETPRTTIQET
jgi:hypothetical protein